MCSKEVSILLFLLCRYVEAEPLTSRARIITLYEVTWVTDGGTTDQTVKKYLQLTLKMLKQLLCFLLESLLQQQAIVI